MRGMLMRPRGHWAAGARDFPRTESKGGPLQYQFLGVFIFLNEPFHRIGRDLRMKKMVSFVKIG